MTLEQLESEALKLPRGARAHLAERLISSLAEDSEVEQAWEDEAERRHQQYLAGEMDTVSAADALAEVRAELSRIIPIDRTQRPRESGSARGLIHMAEDFDAPLEDFQEYM